MQTFAITEGFTYVGESTMSKGLRLVGRDAPSPAEKTIIENLPFVQGVYDFSAILGERVFENRTITYQFLLLESAYGTRKLAEISLKKWLVTPQIQRLYDTHDYGYYWLGKFSQVSVEDSQRDGTIIVTATFDCYPFMIGELAEGNDIWDEFNFELDVAQDTEYVINGIKTIKLYNVGSNGVSPKITSTAAMAITKNGQQFNVPVGESKSDLLRLEIGENILTIVGSGTIKFEFYKEVMA